MNFDEIFKEYYVLFRGQASKIPVYGDREYAVAIQLANAGIKKWERADGELWRELFATANEDSDGDVTISSSETEYAAPSDMRKPPGFIVLGGTTYKTIPPQDVEKYSGDQTSIAWFTGSAQGGYTMHIPTGLATNRSGDDISYTYYKKATLLPSTSDPGDIIPEMSDPTFLIQDMLATRAQQARNGFVFKAAKAESTAALANMKIENNSGTWGNNQNMANYGSGWGRSSFGSINDIRL